jgi:hypothetical protein
MSIVHHRELTCRCGAPVKAAVADSVNAVRHPHLREAVLAATLHRYECPVCRGTIAVDKDFLYLDFERRQFFGVYPLAALADADACARAVNGVFEATVVREAPEAIRAVADQFMVRVCFGIDELRDKLVLDEAGLDDVVVEEVKARTLLSDEAFREIGIVALYLVAIAPDGGLVLRASRLEEEPSPLPPVIVERAVYDDAAALGRDEILRQRRGMASGTHVSLLRLWLKADGASEAAVAP